MELGSPLISVIGDKISIDCVTGYEYGEITKADLSSEQIREIGDRRDPL
jgi:hypothetical protein